MGGPRGRKIVAEDRLKIMSLIDESCNHGARQHKACEVVGISEKTLERWRKTPCDKRKQAGRDRNPANKLTQAEKDRIIAVCNRPEYANMTPHQIVPDLADKEVYIGSESTFYRVLREVDQVNHRGKAKPPTHKKPDPIVATGPNQTWTWDISYLKTTVFGIFFYLYMIVDLYSRKIVGWEVCTSENAENASILFSKTYIREDIAGDDLTVHSDNGGPMKGATMLATLQKLGVVTSFSRPGVSNDNPYSEALFKTLKYQPVYPQVPFDSIGEARQWVSDFVEWYNEHHRHSAIKFVTPGQRHRGEDVMILESRRQLYKKMRREKPERWSGKIRDWHMIEQVKLNPGSPVKRKESQAA